MLLYKVLSTVVEHLLQSKPNVRVDVYHHAKSEQLSIHIYFQLMPLD